MKSRSFTLATPDDDKGIRDLLSRVHMDGNIRLKFLREPSYFESLKIEGKSSQIVIYRDPDNREKIVAIATRSIKDLYLNGRPTEFGYLSSLRIDPEYRNGIILGRGYKFIKQLHNEDKKVPAYITTITKENDKAIQALTKRRAGLPLYHFIGDYKTYSIPYYKKPEKPCSDVEISKAKKIEQSELLEFIRNEGKRKQFFPTLDENKLNGELPDLSIENFYIARRENKIVGTVAFWDQGDNKQTVVHGYKPIFQLLRPFYNLLSPVTRLPVLPSSGSQIRSFYISFAVVKNNDVPAFFDLLRYVYLEMKDKGYNYMITGLDSRDSLCSAAEKFRNILYETSVYLVFFENHEEFLKSHDLTNIYLDVGRF